MMREVGVIGGKVREGEEEEKYARIFHNTSLLYHMRGYRVKYLMIFIGKP